MNPEVATLAGGGFVVVWDDAAGGLFGQIYNNLGLKVGGQIQIDPQGVDRTGALDVAGLASGGFVVGWAKEGVETGSGALGSGIVAQTFDALGQPADERFLVNVSTRNDQTGIKLAGLADGGFVASWTDFSGQGGDTNGSSVKARTFSSAISGTAGSDNLTGTSGFDTLLGLDGDDRIEGLAGNDRIDGGNGSDTASYASAESSVTVSLAITESQVTGGAGRDTLISIENLVGSRFNDVLTGNPSANIIEGAAGSDRLDGAGGVDTLSYIGAAARVSVNLSLITAQNTIGAGIDTLSGFENLTGSAFNDTLTGAADVNRIEGGLGNDIINGLAGNDVLIGGDGNDTLMGGAGDDSVDGGAGVDIASYADATAAVTVSLLLTSAQNTGGGGTDTLAGIEGLIGSAYNDTLIGTAGDNSLSGGAGNDVIRGDLGNDTIDGGFGVDTLDYSLVGAGVTVNLISQSVQNTGGGGNDRILGIENVIGTAFADTLTGNEYGNVLTGGGGNDVLVGNAGNDVLDGGAGIDTASYANSTTGVRVNLTLAGAQSTLGAGTDTVIGIENVIGSAFDDVLTGDAAGNVLTGNAGNDTLLGGLGNDTLSGGAGLDTVSYATATAGVAVSLLLTTAQNTGGAGIDTLSSIEHLIGSNQADTLTGNAQANTIVAGAGDDVVDGGSGNDMIEGGNGNDVLKGAGGDDILIGGSGRDTLTGGAGNDRFVYQSTIQSPASANADRITDFALGDILDLSAVDASSVVAGDQAFVQVAAFTGTAGQLTLAFDAASNTTTLRGDADGNGVADFSILFTGNVAAAVTANWVL
ncbi:Ca2+-binding RTX toxin-like protein [Sphingomonas zeicaulis]|uniref:beta strand repeat-containing protein n=1 Tax=Sphingomonas zeicaulis TaxID=1632740 RepID=UPI003D1DC0FF